MDSEAVFKRYDVRGKYPEEIDEEFARRMGKALGTFSRRDYIPKVIVTRDNKNSSEPLKEHLIEGIKSTGCKVLDAGMGPTDYTAFTAQRKGCVSVQVTSSHLPLNFNGFKFIYPEGNGFINHDLNTLENIFRQEDFEMGQETLKDISDKSKDYYRLDIVENVDKFRETDRKVVVDTMGGSTFDLLPELLKQAVSRVEQVNPDRNSPDVNPPDPKPENLEELERKVKKTDAEIGLATDLDGDRVAAFYRDRWLTGDELFALFSSILDPEKVVASIDTSKSVEEVTKESEAEIFYTKVGDPFVIDKTLEKEAKLSGEPNGHYCFTNFVPYNSGTLAALILSVSELDERLDSIPSYPTEKKTFKTDQRKTDMENLRQRIDKEKVISEMDGLKFREFNSTVLARPSGSSPKIRVKAESKYEKNAKTAVENTLEMLRNP